jgi:hypothetical protein
MRAGCAFKGVVGEGVFVKPDDSHDCTCGYPLNLAVAYVHEEKLESFLNRDPVPVPAQPDKKAKPSAKGNLEFIYYDLSGRKVLQEKLFNADSPSTPQRLKAGRYVVKIISRDPADGSITGISRKRLVVQ